ncbi:Gtpase activating protein [Coemansia erecta]|uniref:Gtpase activating protein n=1 Tax=Coemansia erecta TaxID=147472 RepID=A0A9W7Y6J0_9FUNG|nr:Gtpase activating protein [Coemansia erecta]
MVVVTDKEKKKLMEKHNRLLAELVKQPDNSTCADCGASGPRWASWNLGVFLCIRCGGFHRHLGTHITKVKSINLDNWTTEQIEHFRRIGNKRANMYFNPHAAQHPAPRADRDVERYIRDKYERRLFVDARNGLSDPTVPNADLSEVALETVSPRSPRGSVSMGAGVDEARALTQLREMGFPNVRDNHAALKRFAFNVEAAAAYLRGEEAPARVRIRAGDARVVQLVNMGFDHAGQNVRALELCDGDVHRAIELLLSDNAPPRAEAPEALAQKSPVAAQPAGQKAPVAGLLDDDFFGAPKPAASAQKPPANLEDLLGGLSMGPAASAAKAASPAPAPAPAAAQNSQDLFGDFGDFFSATPAAAAPAPAPVAATAAATSSAPAKTTPASPPSHGGQSMFDNDFIMSLYGKPPANAPSAAAQSQTQSPANPSSAADAFSGLDFFK